MQCDPGTDWRRALPEREGGEVLRGDPDMVAAVADSLEFEHKYRSIVIAWAPEDRPTDAQVSPGRGRSRSPRAGSSGRLQPGKNDCR